MPLDYRPVGRGDLEREPPTSEENMMAAQLTAIAWADSLEAARRSAGDEGKPVLIDFSAAPT
jgi:hypothetical protein